MSDSFDADLRGSDPVAEGRHVISLYVFDHSHRAQDSRDRLAKQLSGAEFSEYEPETGFFDVIVEGPDREAAIERVWNALGTAGADDHIALAEHPDIPEHWRTKER